MQTIMTTATYISRCMVALKCCPSTSLHMQCCPHEVLSQHFTSFHSTSLHFWKGLHTCSCACCSSQDFRLAKALSCCSVSQMARPGLTIGNIRNPDSIMPQAPSWSLSQLLGSKNGACHSTEKCLLASRLQRLGSLCQCLFKPGNL